MPYIEVYVDDCDGGCDHNEKSQKAATDALKLLRKGDTDEAMLILAAATGCKIAKSQIEREKELSGLLHTWQNTYGPRQDFLTFSHHRRDVTRA